MRKLRFLASLLLIATPFPLTASLPVTPASLPIGEGLAARSEGTARIVASILSYTRWPAMPAPLRLCVIGPVDHAGELGDLSLPQGNRIERRSVMPGSPGLGSTCDALYIGKLTLTTMRQVTASVRGQAVVTIAEADPDCSSQAMFCIVHMPRSLSFRMNLDAVSRSTVRIDPRVLRMSRGY